MMKMLKTIPNMLLIVALVALIGGVDVLFGGCMDNDPASSTPLQASTEGDQVQKFSVEEVTDTNQISRVLERIREYLPKTKAGKINAVLGTVVLVLGLTLIGKMSSTAAKKGDIMETAELLGENLQHPSEFKQEKIDFVQKLLCKPLATTTEDSPFGISSTTKPTFVSEGNNTEAVTNINGNSTEFYPVASNGTNGTTTIEPMGSTALPAPGPNQEECTRIAENVFSKIFNFARNVYAGTVQVNLLRADHQEAIQSDLNDINDYLCGDGFFELQGQNYSQKVSFSGENNFVNDAINDITCQQAAVATFPLLQEMGKNINRNFQHDFDGTELVYTNMQGALKIADNKDCGDNYFSFSSRAGKQRLTYDSRNTHVSKALKISTNEKNCRKSAQTVALVLQSKGVLSTDASVEQTIHDIDGFKELLISTGKLIGECDCGDGFFSVSRIPNNNSKIAYKYANPYVEEAVKNAEVNHDCMTGAKDIVNHLMIMGITSLDDEATIPMPNFGNDITSMMQKAKIAEGMDCGEKFYTISKSDNGDFSINYNKENTYVSVTTAPMDNNKHCSATTRGVLRRLIDLGKHTTGTSVSATINDPPELIAELKHKLDTVSSIQCSSRDSFFKYTGGKKKIRISYKNSNPFIEAEARLIRDEIWCPKAAYIFTYVLDGQSANMDGSFDSVSVNLNRKGKDLVETAIAQSSEANCGDGFYSCSLNNNEVTCSRGSGNAHVEKALTDVSTSFAPLY